MAPGFEATNNEGMPVDGKKFFDALVRALDSQKGAVIDNWSSPGNYTRVVLGNSKGLKPPHRSSGILRRVAEDLGFCYSFAEYDKIDCAFFNEPIEDVGFGTNWCVAKKLQVLFEHENNWNSSTKEVAKLALWDCPLKIVMTYPPNESHIQPLLERYQKIIDASEWHPSRWLAVFGFQVKDEGDIRWCGYVRTSGGWEAL